MSAQATESRAVVANGTRPQIHAMLLKGRSYKKVTAFWDTKSILLCEFVDHRVTENADHYCTMLWHPNEVNQSKRPSFLIKKVILLDDNAHPTQSVITQVLEQFPYECLALPSYSADLFTPQKAALEKKTFLMK
jgi:hypothetical protein